MPSGRKPVQIQGWGEPMLLGLLNAHVVFVAEWKHKGDKCVHLCCGSWLIQLIFIEHLQGSWQLTVGKERQCLLPSRNSWSPYNKTMTRRWYNCMFKLGLNICRKRPSSHWSFTFLMADSKKEVISTIKFQSAQVLLIRWKRTSGARATASGQRKCVYVCVEALIESMAIKIQGGLQQAIQLPGTRHPSAAPLRHMS